MIARFPAIPALRNMERLSKMFEELWPEPDEPRWGWYPNVDVKETDKDLTFLFDLPGVNEEDIDVQVVGDVITVSGKREFSKEEKREDYVRMERSFGSFQRSFTLNFPVKPDAIDAVYEKGVLKVIVPKAEGAKAHKVRVHSNGK